MKNLLIFVFFFFVLPIKSYLIVNNETLDKFLNLSQEFDNERVPIKNFTIFLQEMFLQFSV